MGAIVTFIQECPGHNRCPVSITELLPSQFFFTCTSRGAQWLKLICFASWDLREQSFLSEASDDGKVGLFLISALQGNWKLDVFLHGFSSILFQNNQIRPWLCLLGRADRSIAGAFFLLLFFKQWILTNNHYLLITQRAPVSCVSFVERQKG